MKKLSDENNMLKKQLKVISKVKPSSTIIKALLHWIFMINNDCSILNY